MNPETFHNNSNNNDFSLGNNPLEADAAPEDTTPEANETLQERHATRTVLFDQDGKVAIINVKNHGYYKIPGGGIEDGENTEYSAQREVLEETGCNCNIIGELRQLRTEIPVWNILDISDGFVALVSGEKSTPEYEDWERERGFSVEWFEDLDTAIDTIEKNIVTEPGMSGMQDRDLAFLKLAREKLNAEKLNSEDPSK